MSKKFLLILFFGLLIRILFIGNTGFLADISFWKSWSLAAADHGVVWASLNTNTNYPPAFLYVLWLMGKMYAFVADPHNFNDYWRQNNFAFLLVSKSIAIVSDVAIACLIYWFFSRKPKNTPGVAGRSGNAGHDSPGVRGSKFEWPSKSSTSGEYFAHPRGVLATLPDLSKIRPTTLPLLLSSLFFLNPAVILDSAIWGQVEPFGIIFTLIAIILLFYRRPVLAASIFAVGALMKLQNIIYIPIFFLFIARYFDLSTMMKSLAAAAFTFFLLNFPFIWEQQMKQVLYLLTVNSDYFPWLSLNAHNLWWIVAGGHGMQVIDKITVLGILNAKTVGLSIFSGFYLLFSILVFLKPSPRNFILSLTMAIFAFFLFTTQSHERYSYPVVVLLLFLYPFIEKIESRKTTPGVAGGSGGVRHACPERSRGNSPGVRELENGRPLKSSTSGEYFAHPRGVLTASVNPKNIFSSFNYFWIIYALITLAIFFNMHFGLIINYPQNGFQILTRLTTIPLTIVNSYFLILLFFLLLPFVFSQITYLFFLVSAFFLLTSLTILNLPYILNQPLSLTSFKPIIIKQDYGVLQVNRAVNSFLGLKSWNRLSNNYFFYRKGFGTHANSNLVFDINRKFRSLSTDFGVDTEAATPASVIFKINGDGKILFESKKMGRFDFPQHTEVNITGVKYLGLEVTDAGDSINSDHTDWLNPVLYK